MRFPLPASTYQTKPFLKWPLCPREELLLTPREAVDQDPLESVLLYCIFNGETQEWIQLRRCEKPLVVELFLDPSREGRFAVRPHPGAQVVSY